MTPPLSRDELMQVRLGWARGGPVDRSPGRLSWMHALFGRLLATAVAQETALDALRPYLWHRYDCEAGGCSEPGDAACSCGLTDLVGG